MTRRWLALGVLSLGVLVIGVDGTVLAVATRSLPRISSRRRHRFSGSAISRRRYRRRSCSSGMLCSKLNTLLGSYFALMARSRSTPSPQ